VRRIDVEQGRLTLRHGDMPHLDMPPMTMVFAVADRSWLHGLQIGEAVQVQIERRDGAFVVIALRTSRPEK
jgi:Cu/Ag efflux protein CusF